MSSLQISADLALKSVFCVTGLAFGVLVDSGLHAHIKMTTESEVGQSGDVLTRRNVIFIHPDLGIGGAERLIVDAAVSLQELGHKVTIFTSHCDPNHCFDEAKDGMSTLYYCASGTPRRLSS